MRVASPEQLNLVQDTEEEVERGPDREEERNVEHVF